MHAVFSYVILVMLCLWITMTVKDLMTKRVVTVNKDTPIIEAARLLSETNLTGVPVVEGGRVVGIVTESDLIVKHLNVHLPSLLLFFEHVPFRSASRKRGMQNEYAALKKITVEDIMTAPPVTIYEDEPIANAAELFTARRVNPLPVLDKNNSLIGIISKADLIKLALR